MSQNAGRNYFALIAEGHTPALTDGMIDLSPKYIVPKSSLTKALFIAPAVGVPGFVTTTIAGTYAVGDEVRLTITSNLTSRQQWRKSYVHVVETGATAVNDVAAALGALVEADISSEAPYASVSVLANVITITQKGDDKRGLVAYDYTDSAAGTITSVITHTVISEGQPDDLVDRGIDASEINLTSYDTVRIALNAEAPIPFIDAVGAVAKEIFWFGTTGEGGALETLINS
ncbi:MAG: hypothetical protein ACW99F_08185 [Candidatus Hodarchaeales archaeon]|jgi:hypothetical protein